ncbi:hypothetical protein ACIP98_13660 [Streptomyces sp. NPDC088354]|uniref:hypothetical protein n=1 Tax=Streptomyces sp. NPDC088354 TaxID=3365856 RepID=UPI00382E114D
MGKISLAVRGCHGSVATCGTVGLGTTPETPELLPGFRALFSMRRAGGGDRHRAAGAAPGVAELIRAVRNLSRRLTAAGDPGLGV